MGWMGWARLAGNGSLRQGDGNWNKEEQKDLEKKIFVCESQNALAI